MPPSPRLSLCIPTFNRARYLNTALESGLKEAASLPPGTVEILVCDNASSDETPDLISRIQMAHPELRAFRNGENLGFDLNYLRCVEEAHGEFVWVMGDDDVWLPGSVARVLRELDAGADACLCLAEACDVDLNPKFVVPWYRDPNPPEVWCLESPEDLIRYFNACAFNAGAFAFISVGIFRRNRFLQSRDCQQRDLASGYIHVWSMMKFFRRPLRLHYIPEVLVRNRLGDAVHVGTGIFNRLMLDFRNLALVADAVFGDDARIHDAFSRIVGRNHDGINVLPWLRETAPSRAAWSDAVSYLIRAGYTPTRIVAVEFGLRKMCGEGFPATIPNRGTRPFVDLPFLVEREKKMAILALGGLQNVIEGAALLATLQRRGGPFRVYCPSDCMEILDGFDVQSLDPGRYARDEVYRESIIQSMLDFAPGLAVNLDPTRGIEADDLMVATRPTGAIAYEVPDRGQEAELIKAANDGYTCLVPRNAGSGAFLEALGLETSPAMLWPTSAAREEAQVILAKLGWDPAKTLVVLVDHPSVLDDPTFRSALAQAADGHWTVVGLGGKGVSYESMETLLSPWNSRSANLTGVLGLGSTAALLQLCGGFLGGTPLLQSLAKACGCTASLMASGDMPENTHGL